MSGFYHEETGGSGIKPAVDHHRRFDSATGAGGSMRQSKQNPTYESGRGNTGGIWFSDPVAGGKEALTFEKLAEIVLVLTPAYRGSE